MASPVKRSVTTLKASTFVSTGGIVAAATTSIDDRLDGIAAAGASGGLFPLAWQRHLASDAVARDRPRNRFCGN